MAKRVDSLKDAGECTGDILSSLRTAEWDADKTVNHVTSRGDGSFTFDHLQVINTTGAVMNVYFEITGGSGSQNCIGPFSISTAH